MKEKINMSFQNKLELNDLYNLATEFAVWGGRNAVGAEIR